MAARRGRSQARRNTGNGALPGWAWLVLGLLLGIGVILAAPRLLKSDGDGFFRPRPNPDARPGGGALAEEDSAIAPEGGDASTATSDAETAKEPDFDFYTVLPGEGVALTDAQLAATAREEGARQERQQREQQARDAAARAGSAAAIEAGGGRLPPPVPIDAGGASDTSIAAATPVGKSSPAASGDARYILQAGAFGASGDAEELKARIALLGLGARVESASINGKTMYRVRMGPYGTASELAEAKAKLGSNGLPAMAIKAK